MNDIENINIKEEFLRYLSYWPFFLFSTFISLLIVFVYLRYADYQYQANAKIEIIDKAQDSEMALPTAMTVFNRSMINLENEIGVLSSFNLHSKVVKNLKSNIKFYTSGRIKTTEYHSSNWWRSNYDLIFKIDTNNVVESVSFEMSIDDGKLIINKFNLNHDLIKSYSYDEFTTLNTKTDLPFDITIKKPIDDDLIRTLEINPIESIIDSFRELTTISESGKKSDQLDIFINHGNLKICREYLNTLLSEFNKDGIVDRQQEYKSTIDFVDARAGFLAADLKDIELRKQEFKEVNNLTDIKSDAGVIIDQQYIYDAELFEAKSQKDLISLLQIRIKDNPFKLLPTDIGIQSSGINTLIQEYNLIIKDRDRYLLTAGPNNMIIKNLDNQRMDYFNNIITSIENYKSSLDLKISSLVKKENEFEDFYNNVPLNEKILRSIERELEIKEQLFMLLLQKKEEAAINYAVVKPSIKVIDYARASPYPISPNKSLFYMVGFMIGVLIPFSGISIIVFFDSKIHSRDQLINNINDIPIIGEIPFIRDEKSTKLITSSTSRTPLAESIRMIIANLNFVLFNDNKKNKNNLILVTSSIKGEGKTIVSTNLASLLSSKYDKVLLIGADLRNPQIHKFLEVEKNLKGLSDYIYNDNDDWRNHIIKNNKTDILLSGTIPPNPTELLSSSKFISFIKEVSKLYDYVIIDSAPCVIVSDTFEISKLVDTTLYVVRSNFSEIKLCDFINECKNEEKLSNMNLILNGVGNSKEYGYKYGYQYGYKYGYRYGYRYGYNYGYGYGYSSGDKERTTI